MADLRVRVTGDTSHLERALRGAQSSVGDFSSKVGKLAKTGALIGATAGVGGVIALGGALSDMVAEARESAKIGKLTSQVIKSTGGVAGVSAKHVEDFATRLSSMTGVDDEIIQSGSNLLLTFTNIRNAVGKGNDIFDQATAAANDMSVALGQDMKSSSIQLGKALNDPIKGVTALQRAGVSFTETQKEQIKQMVKAGDTLGAQKVILKEINSEFGGAAAAASTPMDRLKVTIGNLKEQLGAKLIPVIDRVASWLSDKLPKAFAFVSDVIDKVEPKVKQFFGFLKGIPKLFKAEGFDAVAAKFGHGFADAIKKAWPPVRHALFVLGRAIVDWYVTTFVPYVKSHYPLWIKSLWEWIQRVWPPAEKALLRFLAKVGEWAVTTALPWLAKKWFELQKALWQWVVDSTPGVLKALGNWLVDVGKWFVTTAVPWLAAKGAELAEKLVVWIGDAAEKLPPKLGEWLGKFGVWIVTKALPWLIEKGHELGEKFLAWLVDVAKDAPGKVGAAFLAITGWIAKNGPRLLSEAVSTLSSIITAPFRAGFNAIAEFWNSTVGQLHFKVPDWVPKALGGGKEFSMPKLPTAGGALFGNVFGNALGGSATIAGAFDNGGIVPGPLGMAQLVVAHGGETILPTHRRAAGGVTINVNINRPTGNGDEIADQLVRSLKSGRNANELKRVLAGV